MAMVNGIVVCIGLAEDLERTLPWNEDNLGRVVVVTSSEDYRTAEIARSHGAEVLLCDNFDIGGDSFNKGILLNAALDYLKPADWTLFFDADVMLSPELPSLDLGTLDKNVLYYTTRRQIKTEAERAAVRDDWKAAMRLPHGPLDSMPYGYFQLWHPGAECLEPGQRISTQFPTAGGVDQWWAFRWPENRWRLLPHAFDVGHLAHGAFGARWYGKGDLVASKWQWVGWSRGNTTKVEQTAPGGVFRLVALDTAEERLTRNTANLESSVQELRLAGSVEQIDVYWKTHDPSSA